MQVVAGTGTAAWSKCSLGSARARLPRLLRARLRRAWRHWAARHSQRRVQPTERPATAWGVRAYRLQSRRFHRPLATHHPDTTPSKPSCRPSRRSGRRRGRGCRRASLRLRRRARSARGDQPRREEIAQAPRSALSPVLRALVHRMLLLLILRGIVRRVYTLPPTSIPCARGKGPAARDGNMWHLSPVLYIFAIWLWRCPQPRARSASTASTEQRVGGHMPQDFRHAPPPETKTLKTSGPVK